MTSAIVGIVPISHDKQMLTSIDLIGEAISIRLEKARAEEVHKTSIDLH